MSDLLAIQPHKVSRDLSGYITYIYGAGKTGKTTLASQMDKALLVAFERGYNAIPGILAKDVTSWSQFRKEVVKELKKPEVKEAFKCIVIDTIDIAASLCEKYICTQNGIEELGELGWGKGWKLMKKEFEETFRSITQMGYALFFISHAKNSTFTREDGSEYNKIIPSLGQTYNEIIKNMSDIYGYAHQIVDASGSTSVVLTLRSKDGSIDTGCRFKYIAPEIPFDYQSLVDALNEAIDKEASITNGKFVTNTPIAPIVQQELNFDDLMGEFQSIVGKIQDSVSGEEFNQNWAPRIVEITDRILGKGKRVADMTRDQAELLDLIVSDLKEAVGEGL